MHKMTTSAPTRKLQAGTFTSAFVVIATWALGEFNIELPAEVS